MIIAFAQQKGGAGKTTLLAHLAHAWANEGRSVALADLDPQRSLSTWAAMRGVPKLTAVESAGYRASSDIRDLARSHDVTLIDCPGNASSLLEAALREARLVIVPCQPTVLDAWATAPVLKMAAKERTPARVVLNRVPPRGGTIDQVRAFLDREGAAILKTTIGNRIAFASGMAAGTTALGQGRNTAATREIAALRAEIEALLG
ncbi:ParA family protein [Halovulum dunhuangense]|uniref:ParA family protein n=1 Tax=Halovulum dunhuangense TaxID=1505036 RepID=A0A849L481_9RHOB|nr:ParA family partition ATPase [Halovulum dunhuangense]NNU81228.1 ParA family protein [Halovulum dunhuangense]